MVQKVEFAFEIGQKVRVTEKIAGVIAADNYKTNYHYTNNHFFIGIHTAFLYCFQLFFAQSGIYFCPALVSLYFFINSFYLCFFSDI